MLPIAVCTRGQERVHVRGDLLPLPQATRCAPDVRPGLEDYASYLQSKIQDLYDRILK